MKLTSVSLLVAAGALASVAVGATLSVRVASAAPAPATVFIVDSEPGVPLLQNDVAVVGGAGTIVEARVVYGETLGVQAHDTTTDVRWFIQVHSVEEGPPATGSWVGMWQSGTFGETTSLTVSGGPSSQGCARSASLFTIHELEAAPDGEVTVLALSYTWFCDGDVPAVYGEVRINSTVPVAALRADRTRVAFDPAGVGSPAADQAVAFDNPGDTDQTMTLRLTGLDADAFDIVGDDCSEAPLGPGSSCQVTVRFTPSRPGPARAILEISDATERGVRTVALEGTTTP
jgi:hypothetical protein